MRAVIFDMDGVLTDTAPLHARAQAELLMRHGVPITAAQVNERYKAIPDKELFRRAFADAGVPAGDIESLFAEKWRIMMEHREGIRAIPGAVEALIAAREAGSRIAVASSSIKEYVIFALTHIGAIHHVDFIATVEDVANGKPAPDIFLHAARGLGVAPEDCVVIEDSRAGMQAAKAAGMRCIGFVSDTSDDGPYPADDIIRSFDDIRVQRADGS